MAIVVKFGGSSLADANQFRKAAEIIRADKHRRYIVPSAPGKRFGADVKVTDMLYACYDAVAAGKNALKEFGAIAARFDGIISDLGLTINLDDEYEVIINNFKKKSGRDYAASRGEYLNGIILANFLGFDFVDAAKAVHFTPAGAFDADLTDASLSMILGGYKRAVIPGFYGAKPCGTIKTFSRGGSDFTGSIVAKALKASLYENWTDVSGFLVADPRIVDNPEVIETITYRELRELSYMGATVLHEEAIFPVREAGVPINIKNTNDPAAPGTMIVPKADFPVKSSRNKKQVITGIAGKKGFSVIHIEKDEMNNEIGFLRRILTLLETEGINFEHIPTGIDTMSIVVSSEVFDKHPRITELIEKVTRPNHIEVECCLALIAVVGRGMKETRGTATRLFAALSHAHINIRTIDQGSSELNIIVGVDESDFEKAIKAIYNVFMLTD
jgi:aspartate kinase